MRASPPEDAFLFFGVFAGRAEIIDETRERLVERHGPLHPLGESAAFRFPDTVTYRESMGTGLRKKYFVFAERLPQDGLAGVKLAAVNLEEEIGAGWRTRTNVTRPVNIDPGLINDCRVILATTKDYAHRIYRGGGIWEEVTLIFRDGAYQTLPWTYPDFRDPELHRFLEVFRDEFLGRHS